MIADHTHRKTGAVLQNAARFVWGWLTAAGKAIAATAVQFVTILIGLPLVVWVILILLFLLSGVAVIFPTLAATTATGAGNVVMELGNLVFVDVPDAGQELFLYVLPYYLEFKEMIREFFRALLFDEDGLCPDGVININCVGIRTLIKFIDMIVNVFIHMTNLMGVLIDATLLALRQWICTVEILLQGAEAFDCDVIDLPEALHRLLNDPTYFYLQGGTLEFVRKAAYFAATAIEWITIIFEDYVIPVILFVVALGMYILQTLAFFILGGITLIFNTIFTIYWVEQNLAGVTETDPAAEAWVNGDRVNFTDWRQVTLGSLAERIFFTLDPADLLRGDPETGWDPPGDPVWKETLLSILETIRDIVETVFEYLPALITWADSTICMVINIKDCIVKWGFCDLLFGITDGLLMPLLRAVINSAWGVGFKLLIEDVIIPSYVANYNFDPYDPTYAPWEIFMEWSCEFNFHALGVEDDRCICDACRDTSPESREINAFLGNTGYDGGAPCMPMAADPCCLVRGDYNSYSEFCFINTYSSYTSVWLLLAGPLAIAGTSTANLKTPDRCGYWSALLSPYQYWGKYYQDAEDDDRVDAYRHLDFEQTSFPMYHDVGPYYGIRGPFTPRDVETLEYLGLAEELESFDKFPWTAPWHDFTGFYPDVPYRRHYWEVDTESDDPLVRRMNSQPVICAAAGIPPNFYTDPSIYPSDRWDGYQSPTEYWPGYDTGAPWNTEVFPDFAPNPKDSGSHPYGGWRMMVMPYEACLGMMLLHGHCYSDMMRSYEPGSTKTIPYGYPAITWNAMKTTYIGIGGINHQDFARSNGYCPDGARVLMEHKLVFTGGLDAYDQAMTNSMCVTMGSLIETAHNAAVLARIYHLAKGNEAMMIQTVNYALVPPVFSNPAYPSPVTAGEVWANNIKRWRQVPGWMFLDAVSTGDYYLLCDHYEVHDSDWTPAMCRTDLASIAAALLAQPLERGLGLGHEEYPNHYGNGPGLSFRRSILEKFVRHLIWPNSAQNAMWDEAHHQGPFSFPTSPSNEEWGTPRHHHRHIRNMLINMTNWWIDGARPYSRWDESFGMFTGAENNHPSLQNQRYARKFDPLGIVQMLLVSLHNELYTEHLVKHFGDVTVLKDSPFCTGPVGSPSCTWTNDWDFTPAGDFLDDMLTLYAASSAVTAAKVNEMASTFIVNVDERHFQTVQKNDPQCDHFHFEHELTQHALVVKSIRYGPIGALALHEIWLKMFGDGCLGDPTCNSTSSSGPLCSMGMFHGTDCRSGLTWVTVPSTDGPSHIETMMYWGLYHLGENIIEQIHLNVEDEYVDPMYEYGDFGLVTNRMWFIRDEASMPMPIPVLEAAHRNAYASMLRSWREFLQSNRTGFDGLYNETSHGIVERGGRFPGTDIIKDPVRTSHDAYSYCYSGQLLPFYLCVGYLKAIRDHEDIAECVVHPYRNFRECIRLYLNRYHDTPQGNEIAASADKFVFVAETQGVPQKFGGG